MNLGCCMESTLGRFSKTRWTWGCCFGAAWSTIGSQILHNLTSSVPGQVYAKHVPINENGLGPPRVSSPGGSVSNGCDQSGGHSPGLWGAGLRHS